MRIELQQILDFIVLIREYARDTKNYCVYQQFNNELQACDSINSMLFICHHYFYLYFII